MRVLVLVSRKGGCGKTTLAAHLAVEAMAGGDENVALIDLDPAGSLSDWHKARASGPPTLLRSDGADLAQRITALEAEGYTLVVVDSPSSGLPQIEAAIAAADLVVAPVGASPHDLKAVGRSVELVERRQKPLVFVINGALPRARINEDVAVALCAHGTVAPVIVHRRADLASSMSDGGTITEIDAASPSAREIAQLWSYLMPRLAARRRPTASASASCAVGERRRYPRRRFEQPGILVYDGRELACRIADISAGGASVYPSDMPLIGDTVTLSSPVLGRYDARVVQVVGSRVGLSFAGGGEERWRLVKRLVALIDASRASAPPVPGQSAEAG
jgi:chromosome partitioning protein